MTALVLSGVAGAVVSFEESAVSRRDSAVAWAQLTTTVDTPEELVSAIESIRELKAIEKFAEESRTTVKAPVLEITRDIDSKAKEFVQSPATERARLDKLVDQYNRKLREAAMAAERERQESIRKAQREEVERLRVIEARRQEEIRVARAEAEAAAAVLGDTPEETAVVTAAQVAVIDSVAAQQADAAMAQARTATVSAIASTAAAIAPVRPQGMTVRREPKFRIDDALAFANAHPDLVTITPKTREIIAEIRNRPEFDGEAPGGPGIVVWWESKVVVR